MSEIKTLEKVTVNPTSKVKVTGIRLVGAKQEVVQLQLQQSYTNPVSNPNQLLGLFMAGNSNIRSAEKRRTAWQNFSLQQYALLNLMSIEQLKMCAGQKVIYPFDQAPELVVKFKTAEGVEVSSQAHLVETDTLVPDQWVTIDGEVRYSEPKRAGVRGDILRYDGQPIYRKTALAIKCPEVQINMSFEDTIIKNNNTVTPSSARTTEQVQQNEPEITNESEETVSNQIVGALETESPEATGN